MFNLRLLFYLCLISIFSFSVVACGLSKRSYPQKTVYTLKPITDELIINNRGFGVVLVNNIKAITPYDSKGLVYKIGENTLQTDFYHEFVAPPTRLWEEALVQYLNSYGPSKEAYLKSGFKVANYGIEGLLSSFYVDLTSDSPKAIVQIKLTVVNLDILGNPTILDKIYQKTVILENSEPKTAVKAFNDITFDILNEFSRDWRLKIRKK